MAREQPIELFMPPNTLRAKAGGGFGGVDMGAIRRAEAAMVELKSQFPGMAGDGVKALAAARDRHAAAPDAQSRAALLRAAHDLKGQAASFDFPLIGRMAASLTRLMDELPQATPLPARLLDAHVSAIQVVFRQNVTGGGDALALTLIGELDGQVGEALGRKKT